METLTDLQKKLALSLIDTAREGIAANGTCPLVEEGALAQSVGQASWKRSNIDDLNLLLAYCDRKKYPPVSLLVVIPGLMKPEKSIFTHAFKKTLPAAENAKRWKEALEEMPRTPEDVWEAFRNDLSGTENQ